MRYSQPGEVIIPEFSDPPYTDGFEGSVRVCEDRVSSRHMIFVADHEFDLFRITLPAQVARAIALSRPGMYSMCRSPFSYTVNKYVSVNPQSPARTPAVITHPTGDARLRECAKATPSFITCASRSMPDVGSSE